MTRARVMAAAAVLAAALGVTGCGIPADGSTRALDDRDVPARLLRPGPDVTGTAAPTGPAVTVPRVYFVDSEDRLVPEPLPVAAAGLAPVETAALAALAAGPTDDQRSGGLGSALGPELRLELVQVVEGTALVELTSTSPANPAADRLPLAVGQIVLTATSVDGVARVVLLQDGQPLPAPLPGGALTTEPLDASDYAVLLADQAGRPTKAEPGPSTTGAATG